MDAEKELTESNDIVIASKDKLQSLLTEKSDNIKLIDNLEEEIENLIISLRKIVDEKEVVKEDSSTHNFDLTGYVKKIGIKLSTMCIEMIKNNFPTTCPTYEELYLLDSSVEDVSGEFDFEDGFYLEINLDGSVTSSRPEICYVI